MIEALFPIEALLPGDEFRHQGEWLEVQHVGADMGGGLYLLCDGGEPGAPPRVFHAAIGHHHRARRQAPTRPTVSA